MDSFDPFNIDAPDGDFDELLASLASAASTPVDELLTMFDDNDGILDVRYEMGTDAPAAEALGAVAPVVEAVAPAVEAVAPAVEAAVEAVEAVDRMPTPPVSPWTDPESGSTETETETDGEFDPVLPYQGRKGKKRATVAVVAVPSAKRRKTKRHPTKSSRIGCSCSKRNCRSGYCRCWMAGLACDPDICTGCTDHCCNSTNNADGRRDKERKDECFCKNSKCLKKYCQCFAAAKACSDNCACRGCKNTPADREFVHDAAAATPLADVQGTVIPTLTVQC